MAPRSDRNRAQSVFHRYNFRALRPGENDKDFKFSGPGVVILCRELETQSSGEVRFEIIEALAADSAALDVARSLLAQPRESDSYLFAEMVRIDDLSHRIAAAIALKAVCS
jgi:hypothetical protein